MLTLTKIKAAAAAAKDYKMYDEKGLFLLVTTRGAKYWRFRYSFDGKERKLSFGVFPDVSLMEARRLRDEAREKLRANVDPVEEQRQARIRELTFKDHAEAWLKSRAARYSKSGEERNAQILRDHIFPEIGEIPPREITRQIWLERVLRRIEIRVSVDSAHRANSIASQIFDYCMLDHNPTLGMRKRLGPRPVKHYSAITDPKSFARLLVAIDSYHGTAPVRAALKLSALWFLRPGELRHIKWSEVNWADQRIEIPAERMKMRKDHFVPLCRQALEILKELQEFKRGDYVFANERTPTRPLSENAVRVALRTMGFSNDDQAPHGFRASARTILDEVLGFRVDIIEHQLAHEVKDPNGRAYNRTAFIKQRTEMMQVWADYCDALREDVNASAPGADFDIPRARAFAENPQTVSTSNQHEMRH